MKVTEGIINGVQNRLGSDYEVKAGSKILPNGVSIDTVTISYTETLSPSINCGKWADNMSEDEAIDRIISAYEYSKNHSTSFSLNDLTKDKILGNVLPQVVNIKNEEFLKDKVYTEYLDMAVIYRYVISEDGELQSIAITDSFADMYGITAEELHKAAIKYVDEHVTISNMIDVLMGFYNDPELAQMLGMPEPDQPQMYIISNRMNIHGAAVIISENVLKQISDRLGGDYIILPSSIHEVIAVPSDDFDGNDGDLSQMVTDINDEHVKNEEVLSNRVYRYSQQDGRLSAI